MRYFGCQFIDEKFDRVNRQGHQDDRGNPPLPDTIFALANCEILAIAYLSNKKYAKKDSPARVCGT